MITRKIAVGICLIKHALTHRLNETANLKMVLKLMKMFVPEWILDHEYFAA